MPRKRLYVTPSEQIVALFLDLSVPEQDTLLSFMSVIVKRMHQTVSDATGPDPIGTSLADLTAAAPARRRRRKKAKTAAEPDAIDALMPSTVGE